MYKPLPAAMLHSIDQHIEAARKKGTVLDLYSVVTSVYSAHEAENIAMEDIAKIVVRDSAANNVALVFDRTWDSVGNDKPSPAATRVQANADVQ